MPLKMGPDWPDTVRVLSAVATSILYPKAVYVTLPISGWTVSDPTRYAVARHLPGA